MVRKCGLYLGTKMGGKTGDDHTLPLVRVKFGEIYRKLIMN